MTFDRRIDILPSCFCLNFLHPLIVEIDKNCMDAIILLSCKNRAPAALEFKVTIDPSDPEHVSLRIEDNGLGFNDDFLERVRTNESS